jgi:hypothetical protein
MIVNDNARLPKPKRETVNMIFYPLAKFKRFVELLRGYRSV